MQLSKLTERVRLENSIQDQLFITVTLKRFNEMNFIRVDTTFFLKRFKSDSLIEQKVCSVVIQCSNFEQRGEFPED